MQELLLPLVKGFVTSGSLIIAIGAQNAFVLSHGLRHQYNGLIAITCASLDTLLIFAGIAGMGALITNTPNLMLAAALFGGVFLTVYGYRALKSAIYPKPLNAEASSFNSRSSALLATVAISLLNPHVYLDTVVLIGSIGGQYPIPQRWWFAGGAALASFVWFFSLSWGAKKLAPLFKKPMTWRVLDSVICLMMWSIAVSLFMLAYEFVA
ncbi:LysE/ArgO family amino acid transporter [Alkalimarinus alittae]|uniref:LysE/ArgO family amino acid transporter n=1 Tax=Alkalimarinus alittae TaxID=2961619 RepID=A0ABY6N2F9_9ALTE|nr:LysE/ArgO family amino acid transporter [Alkalimarinus alittae]UZE96297.1 LysE/ArgO family amino acid transporter [Alkalimarinus alittae]